MRFLRACTCSGANTRPTRRELLFFPCPPSSSSSRGWNSFRGPTPSSPTNGTVRLLRLSLLYSSEAHPFSPRFSKTHSGGVFPPSLSPENPDLPILPFPVTPRNVRARHDKSGPATRRGNPVSRDAGVFKNRIDSASTFRRRGKRGKPEHPRISRETKKIQFISQSIHVL